MYFAVSLKNNAEFCFKSMGRKQISSFPGFLEAFYKRWSFSDSEQSLPAIQDLKVFYKAQKTVTPRLPLENHEPAPNLEGSQQINKHEECGADVELCDEVLNEVDDDQVSKPIMSRFILRRGPST